MNIKFYPCFNHWNNYQNIWLIGDPHFNDLDTISFRTNNISAEEQIKRINSKVGKKDIIIFLGDIGDIKCIAKIKGYKVLIAGNHDTGISKWKRVENNGLFDEIYGGPLFINEKILLSHEPINLPFVFNIHGHDHANSTNYSDNHLNLCSELINYYPISLKNVIQNGLCANIKDIHRTTINEATNKKFHKK